MENGRLTQTIGWAVTLIVILGLAAALFTGRIKVAVVEGISMEPTFHTGDMVVLRPASPSDIKVGDVVVYKSGSRYIIHRVISIYEVDDTYCYVIKGDNNPLPDPGFKQCKGRGIPYSYIIGVVWQVKGIPVKVPYLGGISAVLRG